MCSMNQIESFYLTFQALRSAVVVYGCALPPSPPYPQLMKHDHSVHAVSGSECPTIIPSERYFAESNVPHLHASPVSK